MAVTRPTTVSSIRATATVSACCSPDIGNIMRAKIVMNIDAMPYWRGMRAFMVHRATATMPMRIHGVGWTSMMARYPSRPIDVPMTRSTARTVMSARVKSIWTMMSTLRTAQ